MNIVSWKFFFLKILYNYYRFWWKLTVFFIVVIFTKQNYYVTVGTLILRLAYINYKQQKKCLNNRVDILPNSSRSSCVHESFDKFKDPDFNRKTGFFAHYFFSSISFRIVKWQAKTNGVLRLKIFIAYTARQNVLGAVVLARVLF